MKADSVILNIRPEDVPEPPRPTRIPPAELLRWTDTPDESLLKSVKTFGAVGDGKTDDTAALQRARCVPTMKSTVAYTSASPTIDAGMPRPSPAVPSCARR